MKQELLPWKVRNCHSGREDDLLTWDRSFCYEIGVTTLTHELLLWQRGVIDLRAELLPWERDGVTTYYTERGVTAVREKDLIPWQRAVINLRVELLPWERELLPWDMSNWLERGVNILVEKELLFGRKDELRSWEKKDNCPKKELPPWKEGVTYTHREELLPWQRRSFYTGRKDGFFPERVTVLREELIPRKRSYFRELLYREELLPWQRKSFYTVRED